MKMDVSEGAPAAPNDDQTSQGEAVYYLNGRRRIKTDSSVLISSSAWLNEPRIREWVATESLRRNGHDYPLLYGLPQLVKGIDEGRDLERVEALIQEERKKNPKLDAWFEERFISTYTLADLEKNPAGSIGRLLFEHMNALGLSPELDPRRMENPNWAPKLDVEYYNLRTAQTHDFDHLLGEVGFDVVAEIFPTGLRTGNMYAHVSPDLAGELLANNTIIMFPWFMRTMLNYPGAWPTMWRNLRHGYDVGEQSDLLFTTKFEDIMHLSPAEARDAIGMRGLMGPTDSQAASLIFGEGRLII
jgi:ubiquinone biosynthesis protein COQ4